MTDADPAAKPYFKTGLRDRKVGAMLRPRAARPPGYRPQPVLVRLDPAPGVAASEKPPVRIFLGSEPAQYRAERVFVWSILQVRDPARAYEIYLMKDLAGFDRSEWKTGFTNYRYAIPALAGGRGRAIYNDVDQIYLADPAELFDCDMGGAGVLSINEKETSVMLLDCGKMIEHWTLEEAQRYHKHKHYRRKAHAAGLWGRMSPAWNARDFEYVAGESKLLHFTILHTQPWQPFPELLRYRPNPNAEPWHRLEWAADAAGFTLFTRERPSARYRELLALYRSMHDQGRPDDGRGARETFSGRSLQRHSAAIARLIRETGATSLLDFGSGKAEHYQDDPDHPASSRFKRKPEWPGVQVTCYDPGYAPYAAPYDGPYDGVISTDVLEHIPEEDIAWVLDELFGQARRFVFAVATCYPAKKRLPDGSNAHCTILPPAWWRGQMELAARRHPGVRWLLCTRERSVLGFHRRKRLTQGVRERYFAGQPPLAAAAQ